MFPRFWTQTTTKSNSTTFSPAAQRWNHVGKFNYRATMFFDYHHQTWYLRLQKQSLARAYRVTTHKSVTLIQSLTSKPTYSSNVRRSSQQTCTRSKEKSEFIRITTISERHHKTNLEGSQWSRSRCAIFNTTTIQPERTIRGTIQNQPVSIVCHSFIDETK